MAGSAVDSDPHSVRDALGCMAQEMNIDPDFHHIPTSERADRFDEPLDLRWDSSYDLFDRAADGSNDGHFRFSLDYVGTARDDPTIEDLIAVLSIDPALPDTRATWHRNYTPLAPWIRAHILKQAMGWNGETQLADYFEQ